MTRAESDLAAFRAGTIDLEGLAQRWTRKFDPIPPRGTSPFEIEAQAEDRLLGGADTWDEITTFWLTDQLTTDEYNFISEFVDRKVGR